MHTVLNNKLLKQKVDQNEMIEELKKSIKSQKVSPMLHDIIYTMCYKFCSKYIVRISKMYSSYDEFVTDCYIYTVRQCLKFKLDRDPLMPFSYFTSVINNQVTAITKKSMLKYNLKKQYMEELSTETEIDSKSSIYR